MYESVPEAMKELRQWVLWNIAEEEPKKPCCPFRPEIGARANDAGTWGSFEEAVKAIAELGRGGIGFEFGEPGGIAGIDLDHVIEEDGRLKDFAADIVRTMDSYTEYSPSGKGLHILFRLNMPLSDFGTRRRNDGLGLEIYDTGRYFTVTGNVYGSARPLSERTEALKQVYIKYLAKSDRNDTQQHSTVEISTENMTDSELWEHMYKAQNGAKIRALYQGDIGSYPSASEADLGLCNYLAFWTGKDALRMDRMFRESGLMRPKWNEQHGAQTYGAITIETAIKSSNVYDPAYRGEKYTRPIQEESHNAEKSTQTQADFEHEAVAYCLNDFLKSIKAGREGKAIPTGFNELDRLLYGGLYPGLYIVGAISSLGKTTFCTQIADQIAEAGYGVLIFSLEMSRNELIAKSLSRLTLLHGANIEDAYSTREILKAEHKTDTAYEVLLSAVQKYSAYTDKLYITEGLWNVGVKDVEGKIKQFMSVYETPPVVLIDYLQILSPDNDRLTDKQAVDNNVKHLKQLSRDMQIPVIGISSFNRENYNAPVSMASFKESGAIEYSSDVLIGLQYEGWDYQEGESKEKRTQRIFAQQKAIHERLMQGKGAPVQAKILKHRNGNKGEVRFTFYPRYNYFEERHTHGA